MNWLIRKKKFTYFYNKFRPVNRMYFIKSCVNSSLHNSGCCIRSVAPWITVLSWHTVFTKRVIHYKFTFVRYFAKQGTTHRPMFHIWCTVCPFFGRENTDGRADELVISLASVCRGDFCWGLLPLLLLFLSFFLLKIVFHITSLRTWFPELVSAMRISLSPTSSFIYFFLAIPRYPQLSALFRLLCMTQHSCRNVIPVRYERLLQWQQNRAKARTWLLYKIPPIRGWPRCCY
jgi:hypothetical protein